MPRRTRFEKKRSMTRKANAQTTLQNATNPHTDDPSYFFRVDITKSLIIIALIIALEIALYYGTMNNHLSLNLKLR